MRIAWVCPYPASEFRSRPSLRQSRKAPHPVPWVTIQAPLLAAVPDIELHVVTVARDYSADDHFEHEGIHFHFLRVSPSSSGAALVSTGSLDDSPLPAHDCARHRARFRDRGELRIRGGYQRVSGVDPDAGDHGKNRSSDGPARADAQSRLDRAFGIERTTVRGCRRFICPSQFAADFVRAVESIGAGSPGEDAGAVGFLFNARVPLRRIGLSCSFLGPFCRPRASRSCSRLWWQS